MQFDLPTPGPEPVSAWRPPLYPIPWAVSQFDHFYFARPIAADEINWPEANYRYGGVFFRSEDVHTGVDIPADFGAPVIAAGPGQVVWAGWGLYSGLSENTDDPYGIAVVIHHDFGYQNQPLYTVYAHLSEVDVTRGQWLDTGDVLGRVGNTGFTTGPHLHFEVRLGGNDSYHTLNPELWLVPPEGWGVLAARLTNYRSELLNSFLVIVESRSTGQIWMVKTYSSAGVNSDSYYHENLVLSDLPAGMYTINVPYAGFSNKIDLEILPGQVTYFSFQGWVGFSTDLPPPKEEIPTPIP
jgi:hypothetical protein